MDAWTTVPEGPAGPEPRRRPLQGLVVVLACVTQVGVLLFTFLMGLQWGGLTYLVALVQAAAALAVIARLAARRRGVVLLVPVLSAGLTAGLAAAGTALGRATACGDQERRATQQLAPPPGTVVRFEGDYLEGCVARTRMALPSQVILQHYQAEFARHGWRETPGRHEARIGTAAVKDGVHVIVDVNTGEELEGQVLEVVVGDATSSAPCLISLMDGYRQRKATSEVEPGQWSILVSSVAGPASVVIRDSAGAVVLEQQAHLLPDDDDMEQIDALPEGAPTVSLEEGGYEVECRPGDGVASTVALPVAWADPGADEQEKNVVVRVFETPDHW